MTSMTTHALAVFHRLPENLNCAQTVLDAYQTLSNRSVAALADYKPYGGGRAPDNECGALWAACQCAPQDAAFIRGEFKNRVGATSCRELKRQLRVPCAECVATATDILQTKSVPLA